MTVVIILQVKVERGMSFKEALQKMNTDYLPGDGFCISNKVHRLVLDQIFKAST